MSILSREVTDLFLSQLFIHLNELGLDVSSFELDHLCYRVETLERYEELKETLSLENELLIESEIGGRPIASFKLSSPVIFNDRFIDCLELPAPKEGSIFKEGLEHAEFVIGEDFEHFMERYPKVNFNQKAIGKEVNPDISLKLREGLCVKFHHQSLQKVIDDEKNE